MYRFIPNFIVLVPQDSKSVDCVECVVDAIVRLSLCKTMVSILHVDLISCQYFLNTLYV